MRFLLNYVLQNYVVTLSYGKLVYTVNVLNQLWTVLWIGMAVWKAGRGDLDPASVSYYVCSVK